MPNLIGYTDTVGPYYSDVTTGKKLTLDVSALTADRVITIEDAAGTIALFSGNNLPALADGASLLGTNAKRFSTLSLSLTGGILWNDGLGNGNFFSYTNATGPAFYDVTTNFTLTLDVQSLSADRTVTVPDIAGTLTVGANVAKPVQVAPTTGGTVTVTPAGAITVESINPAGTLANLTLTINNGSYGGQIVYAAFSQAITALAYGGTNITATGGLALPSAATLGQTLGFVWSDTATKWTRFL